MKLTKKLPSWHKQLRQILSDSAIAKEDFGTFRRAIAILFSRRFGVKLDADVTVCLPLGDMINHAPLPSASVEVQYHGASNMMRFQTTRPVAAGEELLMSYGEFNNLELCTNYGFTLSQNSLDNVSMKGVDIAELDAELNLLEGAPGRDLSLDASAGAQAIAAFQQHYKDLLAVIASSETLEHQDRGREGREGREGYNG